MLKSFEKIECIQIVEETRRSGGDVRGSGVTVRPSSMTHTLAILPYTRSHEEAAGSGCSAYPFLCGTPMAEWVPRLGVQALEALLTLSASLQTLDAQLLRESSSWHSEHACGTSDKHSRNVGCEWFRCSTVESTPQQPERIPRQVRSSTLPPAFGS